MHAITGMNLKGNMLSEVRQTHKNNYSMIFCIRNSRTHKTVHNNRIQVCLILEDGISGVSDSKWAQKNFLEGWKCAVFIGIVVRQVYTAVKNLNLNFIVCNYTQFYLILK